MKHLSHPKPRRRTIRATNRTRSVSVSHTPSLPPSPRVREPRSPLCRCFHRSCTIVTSRRHVAIAQPFIRMHKRLFAEAITSCRAPSRGPRSTTNKSPFDLRRVKSFVSPLRPGVYERLSECRLCTRRRRRRGRTIRGLRSSSKRRAATMADQVAPEERNRHVVHVGGACGWNAESKRMVLQDTS